MPAKKVRKSASSKIVLIPVQQKGGIFNPFEADSYRRLARDIKSPAKVGAFLKRNQIISKAGKLLGDVGVPFAGRVGELASKVGYGKKKQKGAGRKRAIRT